MNRKKRIMTGVSFGIIILTWIVMTISFCIDFFHATNSIGIIIIPVLYFFFAFPIILEEIIFLRGLYQLVNAKLKGGAKICYLLSISLVAAVGVFLLLVLTRVITARDLFAIGPESPDSKFIVLVFILEWSSVILSPVLMWIGRWQDEKRKRKEASENEPRDEDSSGGAPPEEAGREANRKE